MQPSLDSGEMQLTVAFTVMKIPGENYENPICYLGNRFFNPCTNVRGLCFISFITMLAADFETSGTFQDFLELSRILLEPTT
jgi:hypothetical protein